MYLQDFAADFEIDDLVRFETEVVFAGLGEGGKWRVRSRSVDSDCVDEIYDAVVVCNGHYFQPRLPHIPGSLFSLPLSSCLFLIFIYGPHSATFTKFFFLLALIFYLKNIIDHV
jgi:hypothetical protein